MHPAVHSMEGGAAYQSLCEWQAMQRARRVAIVAAVASGTAALTTSAAAVVCGVILRGQVDQDSEAPRQVKNRFTFDHTFAFDELLEDPEYDAWFRSNLRCNQKTFKRLLAFLIPHLPKDQAEAHGHASRGAKSTHSLAKKLGVTLFYLASRGGYREAAGFFNMGVSSVNRASAMFLTALCSVASQVISWPKSAAAWQQVQVGFERRRKFPGVVGAVDGTLIRLQDKADSDEYFCRKGYNALNVQAVVDSDKRFQSLEIRPGSWSDQKIWNHSAVGNPFEVILPRGTHILGDSGYMLTERLMVPYPGKRGTSGVAGTQDERRFNLAHSSTRNIVEESLGLFKGRFRGLKCEMEDRTIEKSAEIVVACAVLHNLFLEFKDDTKIKTKQKKKAGGDELEYSIGVENGVDKDAAIKKRDRIKTNLDRNYTW